jgi:transcriptional regulator with XRE-family HTH domain
MQISAFMTERGLRDEAMADLIGVDRSYVVKLRAGTATPSHSLMATIAEKTGGAVQPNDWFDLPVQGEAA